MNNKVVILRSTGIIEDSRTIKLASELTLIGYKVEVLGWDRKNEYPEEMGYSVGNKNFKIRYYKKECSYGGGFKNLRKMLDFHTWLKKQIKDLPHGTIIHACDYDTAKPVYKLCKKKYKLIYDIFDFYADSHNLPFPLNKIVKNEEIKIINNADCTIICSEQRVKQIEGSKPKRLEIIHNTPNFEIENLNNKINERLKICFIGALTPDRLLAEIASEIPNHMEYDYVFGGLGLFEDKFKNLAKDFPNVEFVGKLPYIKVLEIEKECDVLFATYNPNIKNHKYSAPNKFYEAGCLSKPIIVCKNTGIDEIVDKFKTGKVITYSAKSFFDCIEQLDEDRNLIKLLGKNGFDAYTKNFSWEIMRERIKKIYKEI